MTRTITRADMADFGEPMVVNTRELLAQAVRFKAPVRRTYWWESQWVHLAAMLAIIAIGTLIAHLTGRPLTVFDR